jgi:galactokinase
MVQVITSGTAGGATWDGQLCNISVPEYVAKLRDRLPTRIKGRAFVEKLGHLPECATPIVGEAVYKVRSRTEHHIYENARAHQFVERLSRWSRTGERDALLGAGELMYASHWSCGQRCGLGDIATDRLVNALRHRGAGEGIFGARISGCGAGGTVAVLMADAPAARRTVAEVLAEYEAGTGLRTRLLAGSSDGALTYGVHEA